MPFCRRWFPNRQGFISRCAWAYPRQRIHQQQHILALWISIILGNTRRCSIAARCNRIRAESSAGEATTTERAKPSSPRIWSNESSFLLLAPCSPMRPTMVMSACSKFCHHTKQHTLADATACKTALTAAPLPTVSRLLMALMPTSKGSLIGLRCNGLITLPCSCHRIFGFNGPLAI